MPPEEEAIFNAARALTDPDKRNEYLRVACKGDRARRKTIDELLEAAEEAEAFFKDPASMFGETQSDTVILQKPGDVMRYFGDYEVEKEIGRGGMGVIYQARQTSLDRSVAIKMILSGNLADENEVKRFRTEAEAAANLKHPNIVGIHEVGVHEGQHYYSMDLVEGGNLEDRIREEPMSPGEAAKCLKVVAEAFAYANEQGILHRDLKPQNILLDSHGQPHITDFGLAKKLESGTQLTLSGSIMGSPGFMAPEQAEGDRDKIDVRTDVYGLGALLYAMLTGRAPIQGDNVANTIRRVSEEDPISPRKLNPKVAQDLETVCLKCLAKSPLERYATAGELAEDLERFLNYEPVKARPAGAMRKTWTWWQKKPWKLVGLMGVTTLVMVGFITALWERSQLAEVQLQFPGEDVRTFLSPFERSPALVFLSALPAWMVLIFLTGRSFRRQLRKTGSREIFQSVALPVHAFCGAAVFLSAMTFLLQQIRFWVWLPAGGTRAGVFFGLDLAATAACFTLAWIGLSALWEALGSHDSAVFKSRVSERLEREFQIEAARRWKLSHLLMFTGSGIAALVLIALILNLAFNTSLRLPKTFGTIFALGALMPVGAVGAWRRRRRPNLAGLRRFWFPMIAGFFLSAVVAAAFTHAILSLIAGWIASGFLVAIGVMLARARKPLSPRTDNGTRISRPAKATAKEPVSSAVRIALESFALLAALFVGFHLVENFRGERVWRAVATRIAEAGIELDWSQHLSPPVPDEDNFFLALDQETFVRQPRFALVGARIVRPEKEFPFSSAPSANRRPFTSGAHSDLAAVAASLAADRDVPAGASDPVGVWLKEHADTFDEIAAAARRPHARFPLERETSLIRQPLPQFARIGAVANAFRIRTLYALERDDRETAREGLRVLQRLHRTCQSYLTLVAAMAGVAIDNSRTSLIEEGLRRGLWTDAQLERLQLDLARTDHIADFKTAMDLELCFQVSVLDELGLGKAFGGHGGWSVLERAIPRGWIRQMNARCAAARLDFVAPLVDVEAHRVHVERIEGSQRKLDERLRGTSNLNLLARVAIPNHAKAVETTAVSQAYVDVTRVACALERFKNAKGAFPESLSKLAPEWIDAIPNDVTNGEPLLYRLNSDGGYTLYSRGLNRKDDGGHAGSEDVKPLDWVWSR